jgi:hypothetical protein
MRFDRDNLSADTVNVAPALALSLLPRATTAPSGAGLDLFDKIPINVSVFRDFPAQTIVRYASDGI